LGVVEALTVAAQGLALLAVTIVLEPGVVQTMVARVLMAAAVALMALLVLDWGVTILFGPTPIHYFHMDRLVVLGGQRLTPRLVVVQVLGRSLAALVAERLVLRPELLLLLMFQQQ
jgi:hypothetical protein